MRRRPALVPVQFALLVLITGSSFALVQVSLRDLSAPQLVLGRLGLGTVGLGVLAFARRSRFPRNWRTVGHLAVFGITGLAVPNTTFALAQRELGSGVAAIWNAAAPLLTTVLTVLLIRDERMTAGRAIGIGTGLCAVVLLVDPWRGDGVSTPLHAHLLCLCAAAGFAVSVVYYRVFLSGARIGVAASAFVTVGSAFLVTTPFLFFVGPVPALHPMTVVAMLILGLGTSGLVPILNVRVLRAWGPVRVITMAYLMPVVAVLLSVAVLGEHLTWTDPLAALIILASVFLVQRRRRSTEPVLVDPIEA